MNSERAFRSLKKPLENTVTEHNNDCLNTLLRFLADRPLRHRRHLARGAAQRLHENKQERARGVAVR